MMKCAAQVKIICAGFLTGAGRFVMTQSSKRQAYGAFVAGAVGHGVAARVARAAALPCRWCLGGPDWVVRFLQAAGLAISRPRITFPARMAWRMASAQGRCWPMMKNPSMPVEAVVTGVAEIRCPGPLTLSRRGPRYRNPARRAGRAGALQTVQHWESAPG